MFDFLIEVIKILIALAGIFVILSFIYFYVLEIRRSLKRTKSIKSKIEKLDKKLKEELEQMNKMYKEKDKK